MPNFTLIPREVIMSKPIFNVQVMNDGELLLTDINGNPLKELDADKLGKSLCDKTIKRCMTLPTITVLQSNPCWVCVGGRWYYIP